VGELPSGNSPVSISSGRFSLRVKASRTIQRASVVLDTELQIDS
jgi:hypothetical protein